MDNWTFTVKTKAGELEFTSEEAKHCVKQLNQFIEKKTTLTRPRALAWGFVSGLVGGGIGNAIYYFIR